ncbi:MAG: glycosyltransferase family 4 protein [Chloroflexi bacterium]|nr:glycosyltransferase family 4 protein [Chloroflexota bacterium]
MKIAYVTLHWPRTKTSGIGKKMQRQIDTWRKSGHSVTCYMHLHNVEEQSNLVPAKYFFYYSAQSPLNLVKREITRSQALAELITTVQHDEPDVIYLRWGMYANPLYKLFSKIPVVVEINTNDVREHRLLGFPLYLYNLLTRSITLRNASGLVFTTRELAAEPEFARFNTPRCVISNGIDLDAYQPLPAPHTPVPHLAFIGTPDLPWQGVEKLVSLAKMVTDIHIDIIGCSSLPGQEILPENMTLHGYLGEEQYRQVLAKASAAIGTLSLFKKGMQEAAPLKIRECAAYGIPLILPYRDSDLHDLNADTILEISNTETNLQKSATNIRDFLYSVAGKRLDHDLVNGLIDITAKESARLKFFETCITRQPEIASGHPECH